MVEVHRDTCLELCAQDRIKDVEDREVAKISLRGNAVPERSILPEARNTSVQEISTAL
jgi:hypothetical protein